MDQIPEEIRELKQWHNWKDCNGIKIPIQVNGDNAKSNDPSTWSSFDEAVATRQAASL
jgi:primase-polymerase (primpol)-like protein